MAKHLHEFRDPVHIFVRVESNERRLVDSAPFQRLRHIHQLALTNLVYPGATHKRFEHSLGVMELAGRVFDVVTSEYNQTEASRQVVPVKTELDVWRRTLRMAALFHDVGHLPFSHAAEDSLPAGWNHERITAEIIRSDEMKPLWREAMVDPERVTKLALGPKSYRSCGSEEFSAWETILSEIIVGDAFGVDRMDYLLRDSYHAGVAYGRFDHFRLIDTLRILAPQEGEPALGVESGGIHSAEALLLARYFMYSQLYFHPIRRVYDFHLRGFLKAWLPEGFPTDASGHLARTDNDVFVEIYKADQDERHAGHRHARAISRRDHFREIYRRIPADQAVNPRAADSVAKAATAKFGVDFIHMSSYTEKGKKFDFPVEMPDKRVASSLEMSTVLAAIPVVIAEFVFADPAIRDEAQQWLQANRPTIIAPREEDALS